MRGLSDFVDHFLGQIVRWKNHGGVSTVHPGEFDVLEHPSDHRGLSVGDAIHIQFDRFLQKLVQEHRLARSDRKGFLDHSAQLLLVVHDEHSPTSEHEGRAKQDGISDAGGLFRRFLGFERGFVLGLLQPQLIEDLLEFLTVLGQVDALGRGADHLDSRFLQPGGQVQGSLSPILDDGSVALFLTINFQDVLEGQGFEIKPVGSVVIRGDGLGVGIDHHRLKPGFAQGEGRVNATVIEFDALPDPVGPAPQNHDLPGIRLLDFILVAVG